MTDPIYIFANSIIVDDVAQEIMMTPEFIRLYGIKQSGITGLFTKRSYSRAEHSRGVYYLLKYLNATTEQCVGGLLHDIYHTNFSHTTDELFCGESNESFHEKNKYEFFNRCCMNVIGVLKKYFPDREVSYFLDGENMLVTKNKSFGADMIDYFLRDGYYENILSNDWINKVIGNLKYQDGRIVMCDHILACEFCRKTVEINEVYMSPFSRGQYKLFINILKLAMERQIVTKELIVYGYNSDVCVYDLIKMGATEQLKELIELLETTTEYSFEETGKKKYKKTKTKIFRKLRYIDPVCCCSSGEYQLISELDKDIERILANKKVQFSQVTRLFVGVPNDTECEIFF